MNYTFAWAPAINLVKPFGRPQMIKMWRINYLSRLTSARIIDSHRLDSEDPLFRIHCEESLTEPFPDDVTIEVITRFPPDDYFQADSVDLVSEDLKSLLQQHNVHATFYPVQLRYRRRPYTQQRYFALHIHDIVDCFDHARGEYTFWEKPGSTDRVDRIHKLAIDEKKAAGHLLFRIAKGGERLILACDELAASIQANEITGLRFIDPESDEIWHIGPPHVRPDEAGHHTMFQRLMSEMHGELSPFESFDDGQPAVTVHATTNHDDAKALFTTGMSDWCLYLPDERFIYTELQMLLPPSWPVSRKAIDDPLWGWPIRWIHKIARESHDSGEWSDDLATLFMNGDPPAPFAENTRYCGWLCIHEENAQYQMPDTYWIEARLLIPIYPEERDLIEATGFQEFLTRLELRRLMPLIDVDRPNVACDSRD